MTSKSSGRVRICCRVMSAIASLMTKPAPGLPSGILHHGPLSISTAPKKSLATLYPQSRRALVFNFMMFKLKFTEGGFRDWGYKVAKDFRSEEHTSELQSRRE